MCQRTRDVVTRLIDLLEQYEIRATWAVVGHLLLDRCRPVHGVKHPEIVRPSYAWFSGDWFQDDPCTDYARDPFWYGPDLIKRILASRTPQEIGCHGFSHMIIGDPGCSRDCLDSELKASQEAAASWGVTLKSFVFPRNSIGHLDVLAANGFSAFRGMASATWRRLLPTAVFNGMHTILPVPPFTSQPSAQHGLWNLPATTFYLHREGRARTVPIRLRVYRAVQGVRRAAKEKSLCHLWFHPFNLASDPEALLEGLKSTFKEVALCRERGVLANVTMGELAQQLGTLDTDAVPGTADRRNICS
jgi:peptidoglycan/xylan/chitin deacetylase (PgdA/CDA1 family)